MPVGPPLAATNTPCLMQATLTAGNDRTCSYFAYLGPPSRSHGASVVPSSTALRRHTTPRSAYASGGADDSSLPPLACSPPCPIGLLRANFCFLLQTLNKIVVAYIILIYCAGAFVGRPRNGRPDARASHFFVPNPEGSLSTQHYYSLAACPRGVGEGRCRRRRFPSGNTANCT